MESETAGEASGNPALALDFLPARTKAARLGLFPLLHTYNKGRAHIHKFTILSSRDYYRIVS